METKPLDDRELIRRYAESGAEEAFAALMQRHLTRVYSFCKRSIGDTALAEDATQVVFLLLARKARTLRNVECLGGWLFQTARLVCRNLYRQQARLQRHEAPLEGTEEAMQTVQMPEEDSLLLDALDTLRPKDLHAVLLRFFEEREFAEIGNQLGISEDAARMRVNRAVEKMRAYLTARGDRRGSEEIAAAFAPTAFLIPVPESCQSAITGLARTVVLANGLSHLPFDNPLRLTFEGVIRTMRFQAIRPVAATIGAIVAVSALLVGVNNLRAAVVPTPVISPQAPALAAPTEATPPAIALQFRLLERVIDSSVTVKDKVLSAPRLFTQNDTSAKITLSTNPLATEAQSWTTEAVPHINEDGTISVRLTYVDEQKTAGNENGAEAEETVKEQKLTSRLRLKQGKPAYVSLMKGPRSEFLLEVVASIPDSSEYIKKTP